MLSKEQLIIVLQIIKQYTIYDLSDYAEGSLLRRFNRLMVNNKIDFNQLIKLIQSNKEFGKNMIEDITVNTTELFRDPDVWTFLRTHTLHSLGKRNRINIWISGCSTGQEAYSMAILLYEMGLFDKSRIFASDINTQVLESAKKGLYRYRNNLDYLSNFNKVIVNNPLNYDETNDIDCSKYFNIDIAKDTIQMHEFLRKKIVFIQNDLVKNPQLDFTHFDLISCRNVLIYHNQNLQNRIINGFYENLHSKSYLLLGVHESILGANSAKFKKKGKIYVKQI